MLTPIDELIKKATTLQTNVQALVPQIWAANLEVNLRKRAVFERSVIVNDDLLVPGAGDTVYIPILPDIGPALSLTEGTDIVPIALNNASSVPFVPSEWGIIVEITRKALDRMKYSGMEAIMDRLAYSMSQTLEGQFAALATAVVPGTATAMPLVFPNGHISTSFVATDTMNDALIHSAKLKLELANNVPFDDGTYYWYISPEQAETLFQDTNIRNDLRWGDPKALFSGEIGVIAGVRLIATNYVTTGTYNTVTGFQSILCAPRWAAIAYKRRPEAYVDPTLYDGGRRRRFGVIGDFQIALLHAERAVCVVTV